MASSKQEVFRCNNHQEVTNPLLQWIKQYFGFQLTVSQCVTFDMFEFLSYIWHLVFNQEITDLFDI